MPQNPHIGKAHIDQCLTGLGRERTRRFVLDGDEHNEAIAAEVLQVLVESTRTNLELEGLRLEGVIRLSLVAIEPLDVGRQTGILLPHVTRLGNEGLQRRRLAQRCG